MDKECETLFDYAVEHSLMRTPEGPAGQKVSTIVRCVPFVPKELYVPHLHKVRCPD